jgi:hypothetical protein
MKFARLVCSVFAMTVVAGGALPALACDDDQTTATAAQATKCTPEMAAKCTPEMMAACKAAKATATAMDGCCAAKSASMTAACAAKSAAAAKAGSTKTKAKAKNPSLYYVNADPQDPNTVVLVSSDGDGAAATTVTHASCTAKSATASGEGTCSKHAAMASNSGKKSCASKNATAAAGTCAGHGMAVMAGMGPTEDCEACFDMVTCGDALTAVNAHRQTVRLKNGVMYVYTADSQRDVSAVQAAVARRGDQMARVLMAGDNVKLCADCKSFRGAIASGKLTREVVNIEGGTLTLITSSDPALVAKLHAMADQKVAARIKS